MISARAANESAPTPPRTSGFSYLTKDDREHLREAYAGWLYEGTVRSRPPVPIECTRDSACLFCGRAAVLVPAAQAAREGVAKVSEECWEPVRALRAELGGRGPERIDRHLCSTCAEAAHEVGATGPIALARALVLHLRASGQDDLARDSEARDARVERGQEFGALRLGGDAGLHRAQPSPVGATNF